MAFSGQNLINRINLIMNEKGLRRDPDLYNIVPSGTLSAWKNKGQIPKVNTICNIADFLGVSIEWLITGKETSGLTHEEQIHLSKYKNLSKVNKRSVQALIDSMLNSSYDEQ
ncbi:MAG: helix-turn-helix domain-containing protein [Treponema sp.]|nr:helix-turn-helix domain-containing protein [Treponema sp.]MCL2272750.1 helix-turn-helix domain-containing protein [Treponema sp.]